MDAKNAPNDGNDLINSTVAGLAMQVLSGQPLSREQAEQLTRVEGDDLYDLFYWANKIRIRFTGGKVHFCSIVAGKAGGCSEDCGYCSQSKHHKTHVTPTRLDVEEMQAARDQAFANGASSFGIVNSGRGPTDKELDWLEPFFRENSEGKRIRTCATLGELSSDHAQRLRSMGVLRVNHNLETSRRHFPNITSTHTYQDRVNTLKNAKAAGLSLCSGGIFGMGEDWSDRLDVAFELREIGVDVVPLNFLNRIEGTPVYGRVEDMPPREALKIIAIFRFILPDREIKAAGGREKILRDLQSWIFFAGASSFLIGNYLTTFGRTAEQDHQMLQDLGVPYVTFDEVQHEAEPSATMAFAPGSTPGSVGLPVLK